MKKMLKSVTALALTALMAVGFTACNQTEVINAYDIAVQNGFMGTEAEWLASLQGINGQDGKDLDIDEVYKSAQADGYTGTLLEFIQEYLNVDLREDNDTQTIAKNITSIVSVYAAYTTTKTYLVNTGFIQREVTEVIASASAGAGVIIDLDKSTGDALIVTNYHVLHSLGSDTENDISDCIYLYLYGARNYFTSASDPLNNGQLYDVNGDGVADKNDQGDQGGDGIKATFVGGAMDYDIAILRVSGSEYLKNSCATAATIGDSTAVTVGEKVYAIGNPNSQGISATGGMISVESETIVMSALDNENEEIQFRVMRTDAAINPGNSGGGLFNAQGELIGITNAKDIQDTTDNMGYALPITMVKKLVDNMLANNGVVKRAMLGVLTQPSSSKAEVNANGKLVIKEEISIIELGEGIAKESGKLQVGDVFKSITVNGKTTEIVRGYLLSDALLDVRKGDSVTVTVLRGENRTETTVSLTFDQDSYFTLYN